MFLQNALIIIKSFLSYLVFGPRRRCWDLRFQIFCDVMRDYTSNLYPQSSDDKIDLMDYNELDKFYKTKSLPTTEIDPDIGAFATFNIDVKGVHIDKTKLAGFGLGEDSLRALIEEDEQATEHNVDSSKAPNDRGIPFELVVAWDACEPYNCIPRDATSKAFNPHPLSFDEKVILYFHGGSYLMGGPYSHRKHVSHICKATKLRAFVIEYRLAPLNPFPAQLHDALISFNYLVKLGFKPSNIILAGDSAGGHLIIDLFLLLRHGFLQQGTNIAAMIMASPMPGLSLKGGSLQDNRYYDYIVSVPIEMPTSPIRLLYRPGHKCTPEYLSELESPILTPVNGSMAGMPPTLIQSGACEILIDDISMLYDKIKEDNPGMDDKIIHEVYTDMFHVFHRHLYREESQRALDSIAAFVDSL